METQVRKLKINVTNIKSYLVTSNKKLKKLEYKKSNLIDNERKKIERKNLEANVEKKGKIKVPIISSIFGKVGGVVASLKDRLLSFFGYLLLGFLANKLPEIIKSIKNIFNKIKSIWTGVVKTFRFITNGMTGLYNAVGGLFGVNNINNDLTRASRDLQLLNKQIDSTNVNLDVEPTSEDKSETESIPNISRDASESGADVLIIEDQESKIPKLHGGGIVNETGLAEVRKGESWLVPGARDDIIADTTNLFGIPIDPLEYNTNNTNERKKRKKHWKNVVSKVSLPSMNMNKNMSKNVTPNSILNTSMDMGNGTETIIMPIQMAARPSVSPFSAGGQPSVVEPRVYVG